ncbi:GH3 auxin-responsive promoter [Hygrophoropsis aurantiaca]|uniref:GH3 auxin-responsive promoter n=1 Tax=Hygrophoropsis aurantiaca TaxID=72124 RepID=A0ACB8A7T6_9AGAM|nr:GH3 auxin-responsive promoter [Hygrophoropsis aurantiaca]
MIPSRVPPPTDVLTLELSDQLKQRTEGLLTRLIKTNLCTRYVRESPIFSDFLRAIENSCSPAATDAGHNTNEILNETLLEAYRTTIPLSTYDSYKPFVNKFLERPCKHDEVKDLFAPGLPYFIAESSGTSGNSAKIFAKYRHPPGTSASPQGLGGKVCGVYSLTHQHVVEVQGADAETLTRFPVCLSSTGTIRMLHGMDIERDPSTLNLTMPNATSPVAVCHIRNYRSFLLMHVLFALADARLQVMYTLFSTVFLDIVAYMEEEWNTLVDSIEKGELPDYEGIDHVREYIEPKFHPQPSRASELRAIGPASGNPGWLAKIWPELKVIVCVASGVFATVIPKMRHYLGPDMLMHSLGYVASECWVGTVYDPYDLNLFKATHDDIVEYLDVSLEETAASLISAWNVVTGHKYEVVVTTRDGMWRYRLGDIVEIAGFDPRDGTPVLKFVERRNLAMLSLTYPMTSEKQLTDAIFDIQDTLGQVAEFTVVVDDRVMPRRFGYLVEVQDTVGPTADLACGKLREALCLSNPGVKHALEEGMLGNPTIRILRPGTFSEFRKWKVELANTGAGQIKVPVVLWDPVAQEWMFERVIQEV